MRMPRYDRTSHKMYLADHVVLFVGQEISVIAEAIIAPQGPHDSRIRRIGYPQWPQRPQG